MKSNAPLFGIVIFAAAIIGAAYVHFSILSKEESARKKQLTEQAPQQQVPEAAPKKLVPPKSRTEAEIAADLLRKEDKALTLETFVEACQSGDYRTIDLLEKAEFDFTGENAKAGLEAAIRGSETNLAKKFMESGAVISQIDGKTPLAWSLERGEKWAGTAKMLLAANKTPDSQALLAAALSNNKEAASTLLDLGSDALQKTPEGKTPLMFAAANGWDDLVPKLIAAQAPVDAIANDGSAAWNDALAAKHPEIAAQILNALPAKTGWSDLSRKQFGEALSQGNVSTVGLFYKHMTPAPIIEGSTQPLLAWAIAWRNPALIAALLDAGADPNTQLVPGVDANFKQQVNVKAFDYYFANESGITMLMLAAGMGETDIVRRLMEHNSNKGSVTKRYRMGAISFAARGNHVKIMQLLLGVNLDESIHTRVEISLTHQKVRIYKDGNVEFEGKCSTGREGFSTPKGEFVITDKHRTKMSTLYDAEMPYFMRLSESPVGMHQGVVPNFPASHGCIRLPKETAQRFFSELPVGTLVVVNE